MSPEIGLPLHLATGYISALERVKQAGQSIHGKLVMQTVKRIVGALYQQRGWWDARPKHWPSDLALRDEQAAGLLQAVLEAGADTRPGQPQSPNSLYI